MKRARIPACVVFILFSFIFTSSLSVAANSKGNLIFSDRFDGPLDRWSVERSDEILRRVFKDSSNKLLLRSDNKGSSVSASFGFTQPEGFWIFEFDILYLRGAGLLELIDIDGNPVISIRAGASAITFLTNMAEGSSVDFNFNTYKQIVLVVDNNTNTVKCYVSQDDSFYGSLKEVGEIKPYRDVRITGARFAGVKNQKNLFFIDEVRIYTPDIFLIGDSIVDGKPLWSSHPNYIAGRIFSQGSEISAPNFQLAELYGNSKRWVSGRGFGGATTATVRMNIQTAVLDHMPKTVYIGVGHNDIAVDTPIEMMKANMNSIIEQIQAAGLTGNQILLGNVVLGEAIKVKKDEVVAYNAWLSKRAGEIGALYVDLYKAINKPAYFADDLIHLNQEGTGIMAQTIFLKLNKRAGED